MSAAFDETAQVVEVGALVELNANVLSHGVAFVSKNHNPMLMNFTLDDAGDIVGYEIEPIEKSSPEIQTINFVKVGAVLENRSLIIGVQKTPKLIIPGA